MTHGRVLKNDWTTDEIDEIIADYKAVTIPVSISFEGRQRVLNLKEAEKILRKARVISVGQCECRVKLKNCDAPTDVCLMVDHSAEKSIQEGARRISVPEAIEILKKSHQAGLVHMAYEMKDHQLEALCSCCSCCCHTMSAMTRFGYEGVVGCSGLIAEHDRSSCDDCGICAERCQFGAWGFVNDEIRFYPPRCAGCGICASSCPTHSIKLVKRTGVSKRGWKRPAKLDLSGMAGAKK